MDWAMLGNIRVTLIEYAGHIVWFKSEGRNFEGAGDGNIWVRREESRAYGIEAVW
jgi:hypothetical protein